MGITKSLIWTVLGMFSVSAFALEDGCIDLLRQKSKASSKAVASRTECQTGVADEMMVRLLRWSEMDSGTAVYLSKMWEACVDKICRATTADLITKNFFILEGPSSPLIMSWNRCEANPACRSDVADQMTKEMFRWDDVGDSNGLLAEWDKCIEKNCRSKVADRMIRTKYWEEGLPDSDVLLKRWVNCK